jgi:large subunit ribosomal protein L31
MNHCAAGALPRPRYDAASVTPTGSRTSRASRGNVKAEIHPEYVVSSVTCTCGNEFTTRSTNPEIRVEICSECHPFYTGKQKIVDTGGRIERFNKKRQQAK